MNRRRMAVLTGAGLMVLSVGVLIGSRIAASGGSAAPPAATVIAIPTPEPTATPSPTPAAPPPPKGFGTRYYRSDNAADAQISLRADGPRVVAAVTSDLTGNEVYTGTVTGTTLTAMAPRNPNLDAVHTHHTLVIRVTQPGEADVTQNFPNNNAGTGAYSVHWPVICGHKDDAYRYLSCHPLPPPP